MREKTVNPGKTTLKLAPSFNSLFIVVIVIVALLGVTDRVLL